jgi:hypothetical protein
VHGDDASRVCWSSKQSNEWISRSENGCRRLQQQRKMPASIRFSYFAVSNPEMTDRRKSYDMLFPRMNHLFHCILNQGTNLEKKTEVFARILNWKISTNSMQRRIQLIFFVTRSFCWNSIPPVESHPATSFNS